MRALNRTKKQSKFKQIISAPIKVLCKFKQVMGMDDCAGKASYGGVVVGCSMIQDVPLPKCFSVNNYSFKASNHDDQEFISRKLFSGATISSVHDGQKAIEIGKIRRIDEDKPCDFEEEEGIQKGRSPELGAWVCQINWCGYYTRLSS
ncbi:hypothetical protein Q3G72_024509 [Acer saccharum]|nr:hypothetical protein Q3G72_024509 [Acer saccharum]